MHYKKPLIRCFWLTALFLLLAGIAPAPEVTVVNKIVETVDTPLQRITIDTKTRLELMNSLVSKAVLERRQTEAVIDGLQAEIRLANNRLSEEDVALLAEVFYIEGERNGLSPFLLLAQCIQESRLVFNAVSRTNDWGISQFQPRTAQAVARQLGVAFTGPEMLFDPAIAIRFQAFYLKRCIDAAGSIGDGLRMYNGGPSFAGKPTTIRYKEVVLSRYNAIVARQQKR